MQTPDRESIAELLRAFKESCIEREFCAALLGDGNGNCRADAETLETFAAQGHVTPLQIIAFTLQYAAMSDTPAHRLRPRDIADEMARQGEDASMRHIRMLEAEENE